MTEFSRVVVAGGPNTGKTSLTASMQTTAFCTDTLKDTHSWSEGSEYVSNLFDKPGGWVVEGVVTVRALRKWLKNNTYGKPCDLVIWLDEPLVELSKGQQSLFKACNTVWNEIKEELEARGVTIQCWRGIS